MKRRSIVYLFVLVPFITAACSRNASTESPSTAPATSAPSASLAISFDKDPLDKPPAHFTTALTGDGPAVSWIVKEDGPGSGQKVLAQTSADSTDYRFPLCIYNDLSAKNVHLSVRFKAVAGKVDQGSGLVARYQDANNYYVVRANALEDNVNLYHVVKGSRRQFKGIDTKVTSGEWHTLELSAIDTHFTVSLDGKKLFEADDATFQNPGKIGLWTKADSVSWFSDLKAQTFDAPQSALATSNPSK